MPAAFENEHFAFYGRILGGQQEQQPRWKRIVGASSSDIGEAVAQLFVRVTFPPEAKARVEAARGPPAASSMGRAIRANTWMTDATREQALDQARRLRLQDRLPGRVARLLEPRRSTGRATSRTASRASAFEMRRQLDQLGKPMDRGEWAMPAHVVNAYYHPLRNEIVFPAGILQPPFFYADADDAVNYGGIGTVIGHEITHGFDDTGSRSTPPGALRDWWTDEDRTEFERRAAVVVEQFNGFEVADDVTVNGKLTLGENIADLGGIAIALDAMHDAVGRGRAGHRRPHAGPAVLPRLRHDVADGLHGGRTPGCSPTWTPTRRRGTASTGRCRTCPAFAAAFGIPEGSPMALPGRPAREGLVAGRHRSEGTAGHDLLDRRARPGDRRLRYRDRVQGARRRGRRAVRAGERRRDLHAGDAERVVTGRTRSSGWRPARTRRASSPR